MYLQLENGDEQAAAIRRELDSRRQFCDKVSFNFISIEIAGKEDKLFYRSYLVKQY